MPGDDPLDETWRTLKVAVLFFTIASVAFALHFICEKLNELGFSSFYIFPLKALEYIAFVGDVFYLFNYLINKILDLSIEFAEIVRRAWQSLVGPRKTKAVRQLASKTGESQD